MESEHFVGKVAQKAILEKDGKILISRFPTDTKWDLPGGRVHRGEQPQVGLAREMAEELGVEVLVDRPFFAYMSTTESGEQRYFVAFAVTQKDLTQPFTLQKEEVAEIQWISKDDIENLPIFEVCKEAIRAYFNKEN